MANIIKKISVCVVALCCCLFGFAACGDPYQGVSITIDSENWTVEGETRYILLDLSTPETRTATLSAEITGLSGGMVDTVDWVSSDPTKVIVNRSYQQDGQNFVEIYGVDTTTDSVYVTLTASCTENSAIKNTVLVRCIMSPSHATVVNNINSMGIPIGVNFTLNPNTFLSFGTASYTVPEYTFEITGVGDYVTGDTIYIESAPAGDYLTIRCYPTEDPDNVDLTVTFTIRTYYPIDPDNLQIYNIDTNTYLETNEVELILNGTPAVIGGYLINPNQLSYSIVNEGGSDIDFDITAPSGIIDNKLGLDIDNDAGEFTITGYDATDTTLYINVTVRGISNSEIVTIPLDVRTVEYPQNIVINGLSGTTDYALTVYDEYRNAIGTDLDIVLAPYHYEYGQFTISVVTGAELLNGLSWYIGASNTPVYLDHNGITLNSGEDIKLVNNGVTGTIILKVSATSTLGNPILAEVSRNIVITMEYGIRSISVANPSTTLDDDSNSLILQLNSVGARTRVVNLAVTPTNASLTGIDGAFSSDTSIATVVAGDTPGQFIITAMGVGDTEITFSSKTGVTYIMDVEVINGLEGYVVDTIMSGQSSRIGQIDYTDVDCGNYGIQQSISNIYVTNSSVIYFYNTAYPGNADIVSVKYQSNDTNVANIRDLSSSTGEQAILETQSTGLAEIVLQVSYRVYGSDGQDRIDVYEYYFTINVYKPITTVTLSTDTVELLWSVNSDNNGSVYSNEQAMAEVTVTTGPEDTTHNASTAEWRIYNEYYSGMGQLYDGTNTYISTDSTPLIGSRMTIQLNRDSSILQGNITYAEFYVSVTVRDYQQTHIRTIKVIVRQQTPVTRILIDESSQNGVRIRNTGSRLIANFNQNNTEQTFPLDVTVQPLDATLPEVGYLIFDMQEDSNGNYVPVPRIDAGGENYYNNPLSSKTARLILNEQTGLYEIQALNAGRALLLVVPLDIMDEYLENIVDYNSKSYLASNSVIRRIEIYVADGSLENPYELYDAQDVVAMMNAESLDKNFVLMNSIDMSAYCRTNPSWAGIGSVDHPFTGTLFSNGYNVNGLETIPSDSQAPQVNTILGWSISYDDTERGSVPLNFGIFNYIGDGAQIAYVNFIITNFVIRHNDVLFADGSAREYNIGALVGNNCGGIVSNVNVTIDNFSYMSDATGGYNGDSTINLGVIGATTQSTGTNSTQLINITTSMNAIISTSNVSLNFGAVLGKNNDTQQGSQYIRDLSSNSNITIQECKVDSNIGMLVGQNVSGATIWGGRASGTITQAVTGNHTLRDYDSINIGGIVGHNLGNINDTNADYSTLSTVVIYGHGNLGGIVGLMQGGALIYNVGYQILNNEDDSIGIFGIGNIGGVVGQVYSSNAQSIISFGYAISFTSTRPNLVVSGDSNGTDVKSYVGGIVGLVNGRTFIGNSYTELNIADSAGASGTVAGLIAGYFTSLGTNCDINYAYSHGNIALNNYVISNGQMGAVAGTIFGSLSGGVTGNQVNIDEVYTDACVVNNAIQVSGLTTYASQYLPWVIPSGVTSSVNIGSAFAIVVPTGLPTSDGAYQAGFSSVIHEDNTLSQANWISWGFDCSNNTVGDWGIDTTGDRNYGMPYLLLNGEMFLVVTPNSILANAYGQSIYDNIYDTTGQNFASVFLGNGVNSGGVDYNKNIIIRYQTGASYKLFGTDGLFSISTDPEVDLSQLLVYIVNTNDSVLRVVSGATVLDYMIYIQGTGTTMLYIHSSQNTDVYDVIQICVVQGFDDIRIYSPDDQLTPISSDGIFEIQKGNTVQFTVKYYQYGTVGDGEIADVHGGVRIIANGNTLYDNNGNACILINDSKWIDLSDGVNKYVLSYNNSVFTLTALQKTSEDADKKTKIAIIPYLEAQFYDSTGTLKSEQIDLYVGSSYDADGANSGKTNSAMNPNAVLDYNIDVYNGVTGLDIDSGNMSMYAGDDIEIIATLTTDDFDMEMVDGVVGSRNSFVGLTIYQGTQPDETDDNKVYEYTVGIQSDGSKFKNVRIDTGVFSVMFGTQSTDNVRYINYPFLIEMTDQYKNIGTNMTFTFVFNYCNLSNQNIVGTYSKTILVTVTPQPITGLTIEHFSDVETTSEDAIYLKGAGNEPTNNIIAGEYGLLRVTVNPSYASYDFIEVLSNRAQNDVISFEQRVYDADTDCYYAYSSGVSIVPNGIRLAKASTYNGDGTPEFNGTYYMRTIIASAITTQAVFYITVNIYKDNVIIATHTQEVTVRLLAEFTVSFDHYNSGTDRAYIAVGTGVSTVSELQTTKQNNQNKINLSIDSSYTGLATSLGIVSGANGSLFSVNNGTPVTTEQSLRSFVTLHNINGEYYLKISPYVDVGSQFTVTFSAQTYIDGYNRTVIRRLTFVVVDFFVDNISNFIQNVSNGTFSANYIKDKYYDLTIFPQNVLLQNLTASNLVIPDSVSISSANTSAVNSLIDVIKRINGIRESNVYNTWSYRNSAGAYQSITYDEASNDGVTVDNNFLFKVSDQTGIYSISPNRVSNTSYIQADLYFTYINGQFALTSADSGVSPTFHWTSEIRVNFYQESSVDHPVPVYTIDEFMNMEAGRNYILMNDIELDINGLWTPMDINVASLNGNGYSLIMQHELYPRNTSITTYGVFGTVAQDTLIQNLRVQIVGISSGLSLALEGTYSTLNFGLFAGVNNGLITNCSVESTGGVAGYTVAIAGGRGNNQTHNIAGFVGTNNGNITNSHVQNISLTGDGIVAGFVAQNNGVIASSYVDGSITQGENIAVIRNNAAAYLENYTATAGLVAYNNQNAVIYGSYAGSAYRTRNSYNQFVLDNANRGLRIESAIYAGGFVFSNSGNITDSYSATFINNGTNASGFVFINTANGVINRAYTTSVTEIVANRTGTPFIGTMGLSSTTNNNQGIITNAYYYDIGYPSGSLIYEEAEALSADQFNNTNDAYFDSWNTFSFSRTGAGVTGVDQEFLGIWVYGNDNNVYFKSTYTDTSGRQYIYFGPRLVGAELLTNFVSWTLDRDATTTDANGVVTYVYNIYTLDTGFVLDSSNPKGYTYNPTVIRDATEFNQNLSNAGSVNRTTARIVDDIDLTGLEDSYTNLDTITTSYAGILEGNGFTISGINIGAEDLTDADTVNRFNSVSIGSGTTQENITSVGLFKAIVTDTVTEQGGTLRSYYGSVKSLNLELVGVSAGQINTVGTLAGTVNGGYIYNITVTGAQDSRVIGGNLVGGVVGYVTGQSRINDIQSDLAVTATYSQEDIQVLMYNRDIIRLMGKNVISKPINRLSYAGGLFGVVDLEPYNANDIIDLSNYNTILSTNLTYDGEGTIVGSSVGGVAGFIGGNTIFTNAEAIFAQTTRLRGYNFVGGLVGQNNGTITYSSAHYITALQNTINSARTGALSTNAINVFETNNPIASVGGLVGLNFGATYNAGQTGTIRYSTSSLYVMSTTAQNAGGLIGVSFGGDIKAVYATGTVVGSTTASVGGLIGQVSTIDSVTTSNILDAGRNVDAIEVANPFVNIQSLPDQLLSIDFAVAHNNWAASYYSYYSTLLGSNGEGTGYLGGLVGMVSDSRNLSTSHVKGISQINYYNREITNREIATTATAVQSNSILLSDVGAYRSSTSLDDFELATGEIAPEVVGDENITITRGYLIANPNTFYGSWDQYSINGYNVDGTPIIEKRQAPESFDIDSADDLILMYWRPDKTYNLRASINLRYVGDDSEIHYMPYFIVGSQNQPFSGVLNGNGYTISNVHLNGITAHTVGIFGYTKGGEINDLYLSDISYTTSLNPDAIAYVGGLVGYSEGTLINNVHLSNIDINTTATVVGGIVGYAGSGATLQNATVQDAMIAYSTPQSSVDGTSIYVGGAIGRAYATNVSGVASTGTITLEQNDATTASGTANYLDINIGGSFGAINYNSVIRNVINHMDIMIANYDTDTQSVEWSDGASTYDIYHNLNIGGFAGELYNGTGNAVSMVFVDGSIYADLSNQVDRRNGSATIMTNNIGGMAGEILSTRVANNVSAYNIYLYSFNQNSVVESYVNTYVGGCFGSENSGMANDATLRSNYSLVSIFNNSYLSETNAYAGIRATSGASTEITCDTYYSLASINNNYALNNTITDTNGAYQVTLTQFEEFFESMGSEYQTLYDVFNSLFATEGTKVNPILIDTAEQFNDIRMQENNGTYLYYLLNTSNIVIDLGGTREKPLGEYMFTGFFNGAGNVINVEYSGISSTRYGVFGDVVPSEDGTPSAITGLYVDLNNVQCRTSYNSYSYFGGAVASLGETCVIYATGVQGSGRIESNDSGANLIIGGVVGYNEGFVNNCWGGASITVSGDASTYLGGVVGQTDNVTGGIELANLSFTGTLSRGVSQTAVAYVGGILGYADSTNSCVEIFKLLSTGMISSQASSGATQPLLGHVNEVSPSVLTASPQFGQVEAVYSTDTGLEGITASNQTYAIGTDYETMKTDNAFASAVLASGLWAQDVEYNYGWPYLIISYGRILNTGGGIEGNPIQIPNEEILAYYLTNGMAQDGYYLLTKEPDGTGQIIYDMGDYDWTVNTLNGYLMVPEGNTVIFDNIHKPLFDMIGEVSFVDYYRLSGDSGTRVEYDGTFTDTILTIRTSVTNVLGSQNYGMLHNIEVIGNGALSLTETGSTGNGALVGTNSNGTGYIMHCKANNITINSSSTSRIGGIAGVNNNVIQNCTVDNINLTGSQYIGGIAGFSELVGDTSSFANNTVNNLQITATSNAGGIAGSLWASAIQMVDCSLTGNGSITVTSSNAGGLVGYNSGSISGGSVSSGYTITGTYVGGVAGINNSGANISGVTNSATVRGGSYAGGIVGRNASTVTNCTNNGSVSGTSSIGGIVGQNYTNGSVTQSTQSAGTITGNTNVGGIVGQNNSGGTVSNNIFAGGNMGISAIQTSNAVGLIIGQNASTNVSGNSVSATSVSISGTGNNIGIFVGESTANLDLGSFSIAGAFSVNVGASTNVGLVGNNPTSVTLSGTPEIKGDVTITGSSSNIGGIVGNNSGTISNVNISTMFNITGGTYTGGIAGYNNGTISNCSISCNIYGNSNYHGGATGHNRGSITGGTYSVSVQGGNYVGGIAGQNDGTISSISVNLAYLSGSDYLGGVAGTSIDSISSVNVVYYRDVWGNFETGTGDSAIVGANYIGGIVGDATISSTLNTCSTEGLIIQASGSRVGGLAGRIATQMTNVSVNGITITGDSRLGGLVGELGVIGDGNKNLMLGTNTVSGNVAITASGGYIACVAGYMIANISCNVSGTFTLTVNGSSGGVAVMAGYAYYDLTRLVIAGQVTATGTGTGNGTDLVNDNFPWFGKASFDFSIDYSNRLNVTASLSGVSLEHSFGSDDFSLV